MSYIERSRTLRWRLGWLPGDRLQPCLYYPNAHFSRSHTIHCLHIHPHIFLPYQSPTDHKAKTVF
ncbi:MAG: hypothetical protein EXX96DRAFT_566416 [Benjaminiella poitrasii]|nr:MAG: hypothetical protein EXX96DRAFT_566416 [Benjaminiella poitrasii]